MTHSPAHRRSATISDFGLIPWHRFRKLYVGVAIYDEDYEWTPEEYFDYRERYREHRQRLQQERSWWRGVSELQRFTPNGT